MPSTPHRRIVRKVCQALLLTLLGASLSSSAQESAHPNSPMLSPAIHGLAHIAIRVADIAASRAFYEKLGFQQAFDRQANGIVTQSFIKVNDRQYIELYPKTAQDPTLGFLHLCFDGDDLVALHAYDFAQGLTPTELRIAGAGNMLFTLAGPEGQNIEYTQYMAGSLHSMDQGKHLGPNRLADNFFAVSLGMKNVAAAVAFYTNQLGFHTVGTSKTLLAIPGSQSSDNQQGQSSSVAAQQVFIQPLTTPASRIFLYVPSLGNTADELKKRGIEFKSTPQDLTVTDPDGNFLVFTAARTAH